MKKSNHPMIAYIGILITGFTTMFIMAGSGTFSYAAATALDGAWGLGYIFTLECIARGSVIPLAGKLGGKVGRKPLFLSSLIIYIIAVGICAATNSMGIFMAARTVIGFSWGLIFGNMYVMISDIFGVEKAPKYAGIYGSAVLCANLTASPAFGVFCDLASYRVGFWFVIPLLILAGILVFFFMPDHQERVNSPMDIMGTVLVVVILVPFTLVLKWGGSLYSWTSPVIIIMALVAAVAVPLLIRVEKKAKDPLFPGKILSNRSFTKVFLIAFLFAGIQAVENYVPTYLQSVLGTSATVSGMTRIVGFLISIPLSTWIGNQIGKTGKFKKLFLAFSCLALTSTSLYWLIPIKSCVPLFYTIGTIVGINYAFGQTLPNTVPYSIFEKEDITAAIAFLSFGNAAANSVANAINGALQKLGLEKIFLFSIVYSVTMLLIALRMKDPDKAAKQ